MIRRVSPTLHAFVLFTCLGFSQTFGMGLASLNQGVVEAQTVGRPLPPLSGQKAIEYLKQNKDHDSLMEAFETTLKGETNATPAGNAFEQTAKLTASDGASNDWFGAGVAISGETAIIGTRGDNVGANTDQGSAYIFVRSGTTWSEQQKLTAADGAANDGFGASVAIFGETAIIGAVLDRVGGNGSQGSAYVFVRSGTTWNQQQQLTAADGAAADQFGHAVAISGETAIVVAPFDNIGANADQGSAYTFVRSGTVWSQEQKLTASDGAADDQFGERVAISGETAVVGVFGDNVGANGNQGSAYVFVRTGTSWSEQQRLTASDGAAGDQFGVVSISGETVIIGAWLDDVGANPDQGSVYIFVRSGTNWNEQQKMTAADGAANDRFGESVAISGETAIVGAWQDDVGANTDQGSAYIFVRSGTAWSEQQHLTASDGASGDEFGYSVGLYGETAIVGAYLDDIAANFDQGSAYVYTESSGFESDVAPRNAGDGVVITTDVVQMRRFAAGLDTPDPASNEFQRADSSPRTTFGNGIIDSTDVVQARRYATGLDPLTPAAGPAVAAARPGTVLDTRSRLKTYFGCFGDAGTWASLLSAATRRDLFFAPCSSLFSHR